MLTVNRWRAASVLLVGLAASACVSTSMSSMVAPQGVTTYRKVLVEFPLNDLGLRKNVEKRFQETYTLHQQMAGVKDWASDTLFVPAHTVLFPGATYSRTQLDSMLAMRHVEAVLIVSLGESGEERGRIEGTMVHQCTQWTNYQCSAVSSSTYGGGDYSKPWTTYTVRLYDAKTREVMWVGSGGSGGNAFSSGDDLVRSIADKSVEQLIKDGLVAKPKKLKKGERTTGA